jgi:hypothetical protein
MAACWTDVRKTLHSQEWSSIPEHWDSGNKLRPWKQLNKDQNPSKAEVQYKKTTLEETFAQLVKTWHHNKEYTSSMSAITQDPAYLEIIDLGPAVVPLIFKEMQRKPDYWFVALRQLTGQNPVTPDQRGNLPKMTSSWLAWAKEQGFIS